ncbi:hypothetical protein HDN1F_04210 [gamma proteobacterium HdN1]|nr:hypothetical protein HDN1F_04210 [gamma proteobacterium HdN1]
MPTLFVVFAVFIFVALILLWLGFYCCFSEVFLVIRNLLLLAFLVVFYRVFLLAFFVVLVVLCLSYCF